METPVRFCAYCKTEQPWVWSGLKLKDGSKVFVNHLGARWAGKRCPECERQRVQAALKCGGFEKDLILHELQQAGYTIVSAQIPLRVKKDGRVLTVGIKKAMTRDGKIIVENNKQSGDLEVLVFQAVRIISSQKLETMKPHMDVFVGREKSPQPQSTVSLGG